jgi:hypothetical protein
VSDQIPQSASGQTPKEKQADTRKWYQKKRFIIPIAFFVFTGFIGNLAGEDQTSTTPTQAPQVTQEATQEATPEETVAPVVSLTVPDVTGQNASDVSGDLEALGFTSVNVQDASIQERLVLSLRNWFICESIPAAGTALDSDRTLTLLAVKNGEVCPPSTAGGNASGNDQSVSESDPAETARPSGDARYGNQTAAQLTMLGIIEEYKSKYSAAANDLQRGNVRVERDEAVCKAIGSTKVSNWSGVVERLGANRDGLGYVTIAIGKNVTVETWNNSFSDLFDNTLIERNTPLYDSILSLSEGQVVTFSGEFVKSDLSCLDTKNLTEFFTVERPEFVFRFSEIRVG